MTENPQLKIKIQIYCGEEIAFGPGKADLLDAIIRDGSISAAGRSLGMSYRRTWMMVDAMNRCWDLPLVGTSTGGSRGGGARVTELGRSILAHYRSLQNMGRSLGESEDWQAMRSALRDQPRATQKEDEKAAMAG